MKLNSDCVRDTLIYIEEHLQMNEYNRIKEISLLSITNGLIDKYDEKDIAYTVFQLMDAHFIRGNINTPGRNNKVIANIYDITWAGHDLLNSIRPQPVWNAVKQNATNLGIKSIRGLASLAGNVVNAVATNPDVINQIITNIK